MWDHDSVETAADRPDQPSSAQYSNSESFVRLENRDQGERRGRDSV